MSADLAKRAEKLEKRGKIRKFQKITPLIILLFILFISFIPAKTKVIYAKVESSPGLISGNEKFTQFKAKLKSGEIVTVKSKEQLNLSYNDRIKVTQTTSILFNIKRYSFYSKLYP